MRKRVYIRAVDAPLYESLQVILDKYDLVFSVYVTQLIRDDLAARGVDH